MASAAGKGGGGKGGGGDKLQQSINKLPPGALFKFMEIVHASLPRRSRGGHALGDLKAVLAAFAAFSGLEAPSKPKGDRGSYAGSQASSMAAPGKKGEEMQAIKRDNELQYARLIRAMIIKTLTDAVTLDKPLSLSLSTFPVAATTMIFWRHEDYVKSNIGKPGITEEDAKSANLDLQLVLSWQQDRVKAGIVKGNELKGKILMNDLRVYARQGSVEPAAELFKKWAEGATVDDVRAKFTETKKAKGAAAGGAGGGSAEPAKKA